MRLPDHLSRDVLGCDIHTNRELGLMLRGEKPLAVFGDVYDCIPDVVWRYLRHFDRHSDAGRFEKREYVAIGFDDARHRHVIMYALPHEAWRIDAMIELHWQLGNWSVEAERMEGHLLGYSDWQNDAWISSQVRRGWLAEP